jgi:hypothetical protein
MLSSESPGDPLPEHYDPGPLDVCSGRGKRNWNHAGNAAFRNIIQSRVADYIAAPTKNEKTNIVVDIVDQMRDAGYQFLKINSDGRWYDMGDREAREKVGHGLRDQVTAIKARKKQQKQQVQQMSHLQSLSDSEEIPARRTSAHIIANFARRGSWIAGEEQAHPSPIMMTPAVPMPADLEQRKSSWGFLDGIVEYFDQHPEQNLNNNMNRVPEQANSREHPIPVTPLPPHGHPFTMNTITSPLPFPWGTRSKSESSTDMFHHQQQQQLSRNRKTSQSFRASDLMNCSLRSIEEAHMMLGASSVINNTFVPRFSNVFLRNSDNTNVDDSVFAKQESRQTAAPNHAQEGEIVVEEQQQQQQQQQQDAEIGMEGVLPHDPNAFWMAPDLLLPRRHSFTMQSSSTLRRVTNSLRSSDISMASLQYAMMDLEEEDHEV